ncbi:MAG TPA: YdcF family protein [Longimicrobiaceae bacterium]
MLRIVLLPLAVLGGLSALGRFLDRRRLPPPGEPADAALVFGAGAEWKARSRCETAAGLYRRGTVRNLVVTGGAPVEGVTEAERFRRMLVGLGVPAERIFTEDRAANTAENCTRSLPVLREHGFRSVVLVMSDFEGIRAHLTARRAWSGEGIRIYDAHAPSPGRWSRHGWWLTREGRRWTWHTVSRLFRYRLLPHLLRS